MRRAVTTRSPEAQAFFDQGFRSLALALPAELVAGLNPGKALLELAARKERELFERAWKDADIQLTRSAF